MSPADRDRQRLVRTVGKVAGLALLAAILAAPTPSGMPLAAQRLAAVTALMAVLWVTQAIPIAATSLIPLVAFPALGIQPAEVVSKAYINNSIFLFLGGFILALGIEKWGLHRRIALHIVRLLGTSLPRVVLGFMLATAFLSMWISNTASTLLMLPIGMAMLTSLSDVMGSPQTAPAGKTSTASTSEKPVDGKLQHFSAVLMIAVAYSASLGGLTTLVGTPTNIQHQAIFAAQFPNGPSLSAGEWISGFLPLGIVFLLVAWGVLVWRLAPPDGAQRVDRSFFRDRLRALGRPSRAELQMMAVFAATAALWIFRKPLRFGSEPLLPGWGPWMARFLQRLGVEADASARFVDDSTVAMTMALLMFLIPARRDERGRTQYLMDWKTAEKLPWGILLLFGGGFAIADAFRDTGLSAWMGGWFADIARDWPIWLLVAAVCLLMTFMTEFTSNVATVSAILPILAGAAVSMDIDPRLLMLPATISTSCAFMLPIATPPNAIVFGSERVPMATMARYGIVLNLVGVALITAATFLLVVPQLDIELDVLPDWAAGAVAR